MKYKITLEGKTYEVEVERGEAMIVDEYDAVAQAIAPTPQAPAAAPVAAPQAAAPAAPAAAQAVAGTEVKAPLPGNILEIKATVGQAVKAGDTIIVIEAMKMENEIKAPSDGTVKQILVSKGQVVSSGDILAVI